MPRKRGRPRIHPPAPRGSGRGRGRGRGRGGGRGARGPRKPVEPSQEFLDLQRDAINVFIDNQDPDEALEIIQRAIAINPEVYSAHALLSEIYTAKGDDEKALAALFSGAHAAPREATIWQQVADKCLLQNTRDRTRALAQAAYCFSRIVDFRPDDHETRFQRAAVNRELGNYAKAIKDLEKLLEDMPHNPSVLRQVALVCIDSGQIDRAKRLYEDSIAFHQSSGLSGEDAFSWSDINVYVELFGHSGQYEEAVSNLKRLSRWLVGREEEHYWDDVIEDDREWDAEDEHRKGEVPQYILGRFPPESYGDSLPLELRVKLGIYRLYMGREYRNEAFRHFEWLEAEGEDDGAKVSEYSDLYREAGDALKEFKEYGEALRYYEPLKLHNLCNETGFWLDVAACSYVCGKKDQAIECYEIAKASDDQCIEARTQLAKLYKDKGIRELAVQNGQEATEIGRNLYKPTAERRRYEKKDQRQQREAAERALKEASKMPVPKVKGKRSRPVPDNKQAQLEWQIPGANRLNTPPLESRYLKRKRRQNMTQEETEFRRTNNVQSLYKTFKELTPAMREGDPFARDTWLDCAGEMIADFRSMRVFYPHERHIRFQGYDIEATKFAFQKKWKKENQIREAVESYDATVNNPNNALDEADVPIPTTESSIPTEYRGVSFSTWLDIFLEHALVHATMGPTHKQESYETINAALDCVIWYHEADSMLQIYTCYFTCALALNDAVTMSNVAARWFMRQYIFCTDTYRLFAALNLVYSYPPEKGGKDMQLQKATWRQGPSQKFVFRQLKAVDSLLPETYNIDGPDGPVPDFMRTTSLTQLQKEDAADRPSAPVTGFPVTLGQVKPQEMDVVLLTLYGQILYAGGSFPNALSYFYRAYALDPTNPVILLSMALSYAHQMFKRQNENRHAYLMQGLAFFEEYAQCRVKQVDADTGGDQPAVAQAKVEIEFNRARLWQMLGLSNLAVRAYSKVLDSSGSGERAEQHLQPPDDSGDGVLAATATATPPEEEGDSEAGGVGEDWTLEAAYAMQTMYALNGDLDSAREVTERWMVI